MKLFSNGCVQIKCTGSDIRHVPVQPGCQKTLTYSPKALVCKIIVLISASFGTYTRSLSLDIESGLRKKSCQ